VVIFPACLLQANSIGNRTKREDDLSRPVYGVMGIPVEAVDFATVIASIKKASGTNRPFLISTPNVNFLISSRVDASFRETLLQSELCPVDGAPIVLIARMLGVPITARIAGSDTFEMLKQDMSGTLLNVFLFGGTDEAGEKLCKLLNAGTGLRCVGRLNPGFGSVEELSKDHIIDQINASSADLLAVFLSSEKAQKWLLNNHARLTVPVRFDFGGTINFQAGLVRRAPLRLRQLGLEWLWRIKEEPYLWRRYWADGRQLAIIFLSAVLPLALEQLLRRFKKGTVLRIEQQAGTDIVLMRMSGDAVAPYVPEAIEAFRQACALEQSIVVDLADVGFIDARFFGLFLMARKTLSRSALTIRFTRISPTIERLFLLNGFDYLLNG
jgi:N-acetylglucosaminyldiphosphoundecaprenol N-acetyl-beta-D-mannosaminyltransferase